VRTLLVMRHAKSDWGDAALSDHDRPLNRRGLRDAPRMGEWIRDHAGVPDRILSSTAVRAFTTAQRVAEAAGFAGTIEARRDLYLVDASRWREIVALAGDDAEVLLTVSHNPGVEEIVETLGGGVQRMPTAAVAWFEVEGDWAELAARTCRLREIWRPKELPAP